MTRPYCVDRLPHRAWLIGILPFQSRLYWLPCHSKVDTLLEVQHGCEGVGQCEVTSTPSMLHTFMDIPWCNGGRRENMGERGVRDRKGCEMKSVAG